MRGKSVWDGCVKAVYGLLFFLLIGMSAYIFYGALDTLQYAEAFEKLLDSFFEDKAWDISSDINVMKTMLKQEGLTGRDFAKE